MWKKFIDRMRRVGQIQEKGRSLQMRGFTLVETMVVVAILVILVGMGAYGYSNYLKTARRDACYTDQTVFAQDFELVMQDYGVLYIPLATEQDERERLVKNFLNVVESDYLHCYLAMDTLEINEKWFSVETENLMDPWGMPYLLMYHIEYDAMVGTDTATAKRTPGDAMVISGGENMEITRYNGIGSSAYLELDFDDDKVLLVDAKNVLQ